MKKARFEWDEDKDRENQAKHGVSFGLAQHAFLDPHRIIAQDLSHSAGEERFYCMGRVNDDIATVRFTFRGDIIRIFGAGYWRKGKKIYEEENKIRR
jgi:uncharacterized DUF497 family protein